MLKKVLSLALAMALVATMLVGCSSSGSKTSSGSSNVTLKMWYWNRSTDDAVIKSVHTKYPNITVQATKIGGDYLQKVTTTLAAGSGMPDILFFNDWVTTMLANKDKFVNLYDAPYNAKSIESNYLDWKWKLGESADGKTLIAIPIDTGPTGLFYRTDVFEKAGLSADPTQVTNLTKTWDDYFAVGDTIKAKTGLPLFDNINNVYTQMCSQAAGPYIFDKSGNFIGDNATNKNAFTKAGSAVKYSAKIAQWTTDWNAAATQGKFASFVAAVWYKAILKDSAADASGKWGVAATPGGPGNNGGSFVGIPKSSQHPQEAWKAISYMMNDENNVTNMKNLDLFPSSKKAIADSSIITKETYFANQETNKVFVDAAQNIPIRYLAPTYTTYQTYFTDQLKLVETQNKSVDTAWSDALAKCKDQIARTK